MVISYIGWSGRGIMGRGDGAMGLCVQWSCGMMTIVGSDPSWPPGSA